MDDYLDDGDESDYAGVVGVVHIVIFIVAGRYAWQYCCKRGAPETIAASNEQPMATPEQLQQKKTLSTTYLLWVSAGAVGVHHFYLGRIVHGLLAAWSMNLLGFGWLLDAFLIPYYVRDFNSKRSAPQAPYDKTTRALCIRLPLTIITIVGLIFGVVVYGPYALHLVGLVDIDRIAAQTQANPYDTLGLSRHASLADAKAAYRKQSLLWHPDRNLGCGKECELKMFEITKAFELVKKRKAPAPADQTWTTFAQNVGQDWMSVFEVFQQQQQDSPPPRERGRGSTKGRDEF